MKITEIERCKVQAVIEIPVDELSQSTLKEAQELLGYIPVLTEESTPNKLHQVLAECGIEILNWHDVLKYEALTCHEHRMEQISKETRLPSGRGSWDFKAWQQTKLAEWKSPIPLHVIEKANQIKRRLPEVEFFVEALSETPDPFLVAKIQVGEYKWDNVEYFIEVWEEPKFER